MFFLKTGVDVKAYLYLVYLYLIEKNSNCMKGEKTLSYNNCAD